jgi:hypothetical protein
MALNCCKSIFDKADFKSPFDKAIAFSYYDGAKSGITKCSTCGNEYFFELLSWDANQDVRIYGLSLTPAGAFEKIIALAKKFDVPRWPEWCPTLNDKRLAAEQTVLKDEINELVSAEGPVTFVIATENLTQKINLARKIIAGDHNVPPLQERLDDSAFLEWQKFLGDRVG